MESSEIESFVDQTYEVVGNLATVRSLQDVNEQLHFVINNKILKLIWSLNIVYKYGNDSQIRDVNGLLTVLNVVHPELSVINELFNNDIKRNNFVVDLIKKDIDLLSFSNDDLSQEEFVLDFYQTFLVNNSNMITEEDYSSLIRLIDDKMDLLFRLMSSGNRRG